MKGSPAADMPADGADIGPCPLCDRPMVAGPSVNLHHLVPRRFKGREAVTVHRICHDKIHAVLSDKDLRDRFQTVALLREQPEIAAFRQWVARKPPTFVDGHHTAPRRR